MFKSGEQVLEISDCNKLPNSPVVSVLMITYNHEKFISQAIESILEQVADFPFELVIGEDCSTDSTRDILKSYQEKYPEKIRIIFSEKNVGVNKNFVRTYLACKSDYIAICEGDDFWNDKYKLMKQVGFLDANPTYVMAYHDYFPVTSEGVAMSDGRSTWYSDYNEDEIVLGCGGHTLTLCFRKVISVFPIEVFNVVGVDIFMKSLLGWYGKGKYISDIEPASYRVHSGGVWSGIEYDKQAITAAVTRYWLAVYYSRTGHRDVASRYLCSCLDYACSSLDIERLIFVKWFLRKIFPSFFSFYHTVMTKFR